jgi:hypothetical protein
MKTEVFQRIMNWLPRPAGRAASTAIAGNVESAMGKATVSAGNADPKLNLKALNYGVPRTIVAKKND